jgi:hypothetical protein
MVGAQAIALTLAGIVIGGGGALALTRLVPGLLFATKPAALLRLPSSQPSCVGRRP